MPDSSVPINAPTTVGQSMASFLDAGGNEHEKTIAEFINGGGQPVKVSAADPLPVTDAVSEAALNSIAAEDFATEATLSAINAKLTNPLPVSGTVVTGGLTDAQLRATPVPVSGTLAAVTAITNNVNTVEVAPTTVFNGKTVVTTAGTRVTLAASTTVKSVTIKALSTNTGLIFVGNATVASTNGFQLSAGDTISFDIANLNTVNIDSSVSGESCTYIGVN